MSETKKTVDLLTLVRDGKLVLIDKAEIAELRKQAKNATEELNGYQRRLSNQKDLVYECNCERKTPACTYIHSVDPDRSPRNPKYCTIDGKGARWLKVKPSAKSADKPT